MPTDSGDVTIPHGISTVTLTCSLGAAKRVNALYGNYVEAIRHVMTFNLQAHIEIIAAALDKKATEIEEAVYVAGMEALSVPGKKPGEKENLLLRYISNLSNGGRPVAPAAVTPPPPPGNV